ncbi:MAG: FAD-dependent oxidoreductase [Gemmatimonadaceae bacterium]
MHTVRTYASLSNVNPTPQTNSPAWAEDLPADFYPALAGDVETDVCVVGLGGSGLACIHELLGLGRRVIGLDAEIVGGGAAGRNGGFLLAGTASFYHRVVDQLGRQRARQIYRLTLEEMDRITAETPDIVRRSGSLRIAASPEEMLDCDMQLQALRADGFAAEPYEGNEGSGLVFPSNGSYNPLARCRTLARTAAGLGAALYEHSRAISFGNGEVRTEHGRVVCNHIIIAVDGRLDLVVPELSKRVRTARLQMLSTEPIAEIVVSRPVYRRWGYDYWQQLPDRRVVLGACRDKFLESEWTTDSDPTEEVQQCMNSVLRETVGVEGPVQQRWAASVSYSTGILPVLANVRPGVWAIGGYNGTGNVMGSIYGRMVAQLVVAGRSDLSAPFLAGG